MRQCFPKGRTYILLWDSRAKRTNSGRGLSLSWPGGVLSSSFLSLSAAVPCKLAEGTFPSNLDLPLGDWHQSSVPPVPVLDHVFTQTPVSDSSASNRFWWKPVLFNPQDSLWAWFFYYPSCRDEETEIQSPYLCCQGPHTHGMEKLAFKPTAENFKGCFLSTRLSCTGPYNYLSPTDTIDHRTEEKTWNHSRERRLVTLSSACISFPASYPSLSLPPYGLFYTLSFYLRNTAKPQFPVFCLIIQGRK